LKVLDVVKDGDVRVYSVWVPILGSDEASKVGKATTRLSDSRVKHYWDGNGDLMQSYARVLDLGKRPAWDVYLLYGSEAEWKTDPPMPDSWMHQLRDVDESRLLKGETLAAELAVLVERRKGKGK